MSDQSSSGLLNRVICVNIQSLNFPNKIAFPGDVKLSVQFGI